jgi:FlaA1/EpsC-like NDP-sugar epimerase
MKDFLLRKRSALDNCFCGNHLLRLNVEELLDRPTIDLDQEHISVFIRNKRIMITGAAGSIGRELMLQILSFKPKQLLLIDSNESGIYELDSILGEIPPGETDIQTIPANITDKHRMSHIFERYLPELIFHAAANKHVPMMEKHPYEAIKNNIFGTILLSDLSVCYKVEKFIFISTDKAVNPASVMGASKRVCEMYLQSLNNKPEVRTQFLTTRFGNVLGTQGSVLPLFVRQINERISISLTHRDMSRYFITVREACLLVLEAGTVGRAGEVFVFDMGEPVVIRHMAEKLITWAGLKVGTDIKLLDVGLRPGEKLFEERLQNDEVNSATHHANISIAYPKPVCNLIINRMLEQLQQAMEIGDEDQMVKVLKDMVPEYISNHSRFEKLDWVKKESIQV